MRRARLEMLAVGLCVLIAWAAKATGPEDSAVGLSCGQEDQQRLAGKPLSYWIAKLKSENESMRLEAAEELAKIGPQRENRLTPAYRRVGVRKAV